MRNPKIEYLRYKITHDETVKYDVEGETRFEVKDWQIRIKDGEVFLEPEEYFRSEREALEAVEPLVRHWEISVQLGAQPRVFKLEYLDCQIIDLEPEPGGIVMYAQPGRMKIVGGQPSILITRIQYPAPPFRYATSPELEAMFARYVDACDNPRLIAPCAFFCLTFLERDFEGKKNKRRKTGEKYAIHLDVLSQMGQLTSTKGADIARKAEGWDEPYTIREQQWLFAAMKKMIERKATLDAEPENTPNMITMDDLPVLD